jgi:hypothetical protein
MLLTDASDTAAEMVGRSRIAVLVPSYNEGAAIGKAVADFELKLPANLPAEQRRRS